MALSGPELRSALAGVGLSIEAADDALASLAAQFQLINDNQKAHYEKEWAIIKQKFDAAISSAADLQGFIKDMRVSVQSAGVLSTYMQSLTQGLRINYAEFEPVQDTVVIVKGGAYTRVLSENAEYRPFIEQLADRVGPTTQAVVELGCGSGRNLAEISLIVGREDVCYVACEQSESGRACATQMMSLPGGARHDVHAFDFLDADFEMLRKFDDVLVFSVAAIEQIAYLPVDFIARIMDGAPNVTLMFIEPFGWQVNPAVAAGARTALIQCVNSRKNPSDLANQHEFALTDASLDANSAVWSIASCYNQNLYPLIQAAASSDMCTLDELVLNFVGGNLFNPYSLAVLTKT